MGNAPATIVAVGHMDMEGSESLDPNQPFFLGSISKSYTATVLMRLVEEGLVSLDDPLDRWLPDFPRGDEIVLSQLLYHTSGLKDFYSYLYFRPEREEMIELVTKPWTQAELLALSERFGHWFDPGEDWSYSSTNYYLLGVVIERASGLTLEAAYRRYLESPLGMERTWLAYHEAARGTLPIGHMGPVAGWEHSEMFGKLGATTRLDESPVEWGAGGVAAPAVEALSFLGGLMRGRLVSESSLEAMTRFRSTPPLGIPETSDTVAESENGYGLGLVRMIRGGRTFIGHGGLFTGHTAGLWYVSECDATIAVYFNRGFVGQRDLLDRVLDLMAAENSALGQCHRSEGVS